MSGRATAALRRAARAGTPERATLSHVDGVHELINGFAARGVMLPKSREQLCRHIREYFVVTDEEERVVGCGGLRIYTPGLAEIVGLAVAEAAHGQGVGRRLVDCLEVEADGLGIPRVFAMTLEAGFFERMGYEVVERCRFPEKIEADCSGCFKRAVCREVAVEKTLPEG